MNAMRFAVCLLIGTMFFVFSCKDPSFEPLPPKERTFLHVLNLYDGLNAGVDLRLRTFDETRIIKEGLKFTQAWPPSGYASLLTSVNPDSANGESGVFMDVVDHNTKDLVVPARTMKLAAETYATICLIDSFGKPLLVKTIDNLDPVPNGYANIRFMNLNSALLSVSLVSKNDSLKIEKLNFLNYSGFEPIETGVHTLYFVNDFSGDRVDSIKNIELKAGKTYSTFLSNQGGAPKGGYEVLDQ